MEKNKYDEIATKLILREIIDKYDLNNKQSDVYIYVRFKKGMYVLFQAVIISH